MFIFREDSKVRFLAFCVCMLGSLSAYSDYRVLVMKGCYQNLSSSEALKRYIQVESVDTLISNALENYEFELWSIKDIENKGILMDIQNVAIKCGYQGAHLFRGIENFTEGWKYFQKHANPSDYLIRYDLESDTYYLYAEDFPKSSNQSATFFQY